MPFANSVVPQTITEEIIIPIAFALKAVLVSTLKIYPAILPAYTPVPGRGIITKNMSPQKPYFLILSPEPTLALLAIQIAIFLYACHLKRLRLMCSKKNIIIGKTKILAKIEINKTQKIFKS